jgi:hypothetical protein
MKVLHPSESIWYYRTRPAGHVSQILCADVERLEEVRIKRPGSRTAGLVSGPAFPLA